MKVAVLYGGISRERDVSLSTGKGMAQACRENGHDVVEIDFRGTRKCLEKILHLNVDLVFIGLHGRLGEDGRVQALLDMLNIPYVGSGVLASSLAMDKAKAKQFFNQAGIRIAREVLLYKNEFDPNHFSMDLPLPVVIKPNQEGSTIGLTIAKTMVEVVKGIKEAFQFDDKVLVEEFIGGKEVTVAVLGNRGNVKSLPVVEIVPKNEYYDYESKYAQGGSEHFVPARITADLTRKLQKQSAEAHNILGCDTYSRVDFIIPNDGSEPVILEVNTLPGMTPTSLFPDAAREVGYDYNQMMEKLANLSLIKGSAN
ncbi:D-alanine--D-alanine ligase family protein [Alteribacter populi]|uniref:D-alanine--D-alanine ligase family protein n=1 Tax=Alteribacter populi TaxID=2011011 RepID=UPI000BBB616E|nr:D-alanine--D-alanine ligase [Alteribacter populi]